MIQECELGNHIIEVNLQVIKLKTSSLDKVIKHQLSAAYPATTPLNKWYARDETSPFSGTQVNVP